MLGHIVLDSRLRGNDEYYLVSCSSPKNNRPQTIANSERLESKANPDAKAELTIVSEHFKEGFQNAPSLPTIKRVNAAI